MSNDINSYRTKSGKKRFKFEIYLGIDSLTGRSILIRKKGFKTEKEAKEKYYEYQLKIAKGEYAPIKEKKIHFKELYDLWLKVYKTTVKESTYATTLRYFKDHILGIFSSKYIDKITVLDCQRAVNKWFNDAPRTYKRFMRYTSNVLDYGVNLELINKNPMKKVIRPKLHEEPKPFTDFYSKEELNEYLKDAKEYNYQYFMFFRLLAYSGMRKGECLALKWTDINFKKNTIRINKSVTQGLNNRLYLSDGKTKASVRTLDMDAQTMNYLKRWRLMQQKKMLQIGFNFLSADNFLFPTIYNGITEPSKPTEWNNAICKKYNLRHIKVHGFRHTHASLLFEAGVPMEDVKERLGHSSIETTMNIYTHVTKTQKQETAIQFARYMES